MKCQCPFANQGAKKSDKIRPVFVSVLKQILSQDGPYVLGSLLMNGKIKTTLLGQTIGVLCNNMSVFSLFYIQTLLKKNQTNRMVEGYM